MKEIIKEYKEIIISIIIITIIILIRIFFVNGESKNNIELKNKKINDNIVSQEDIKDNSIYGEEETILSMQKGEKFVKLGDIIIYINDEEGIWSFDIKNKVYKKLCKLESGAEKIYFDGDYIYAIPYYYRGKGIYKIDLSGKVEKIYGGSSIQLWLEDDKIYFVDQIGYDEINGTPQGNLCVMDKDGNNKKVIIENVKNYFYINNNYVYYIDNYSRSIYRANMNGKNKIELAKGRCYITGIDKNSKYLTYVDYNDDEKHRILYLDNNENHEVGRFGNVIYSKVGTFYYTRKILDNDNIENEKSLFIVNENEEKENICWRVDEIGLEYLAYAYKDYVYIRSNGYYRVKISNKDERESLEFGSETYFLDGKAYCFKISETKIEELYIYNLDDLSKETIKIN